MRLCKYVLYLSIKRSREARCTRYVSPSSDCAQGCASTCWVSSTTRRRSLWNHHLSDRLMFLPPSQFVYKAATHRLRRQFSLRSEDSTCHGSASATGSLPLRPRIKSDHDSTRCGFVTASSFFVACTVEILRGRETLVTRDRLSLL
jgi:hypothetical protein